MPYWGSDMPAITYHFINVPGAAHRAVEQGARLYRKFTRLDSDGDPIDMTDWTARMQGRLSVESDLPLFDWTTDDYLTINGTEGELVLDVPAEVTATLTFRTCVYDIELTDDAEPANTMRFAEGRMELSREVTREVPT